MHNNNYVKLFIKIDFFVISLILIRLFNFNWGGNFN